ncbi:MAG: 4-hydroxybutyrate CoA-transferase, partial [Actinomycetota bacterium]|nr:4-hydroxybutyrate CoA-transferase [Actinomycetota bacterium]
MDLPAASLRSLDDAAALLRPTDRLGIPLGPGHPAGFLKALGARTDWVDLVVSGALLTDLYELFTRPNVHYRSGFFGPAERFLRDAGADVQFVPADFRRFGPFLDTLSPRVLATVASPPDADGWMSLSLHAGATVGALHRAGADADRTLLVEVNEAFPRTLGLPPEHRHAIHVDEADVIVVSDAKPFTIDDPPPTEAEQAIARHAAAFVTDGCTLQTGIGGVPGTVAALLAEGPGGDYGIHSEMFTTGLMRLQRAGKVSNARKGVYDGFSVTTFAAGSAELYDWLDGNDEVRFLPVDLVNAPHVIAANRQMVTINGALAVDLAGQVVADSLLGTQFSGIGGHEDFISSSGFELSDRSLVCLPSMSLVAGQPVSRIVGQLPTGSIVTTPRHQLDVVVTEHGVAELRGLTVRERAQALAAIADPTSRDELAASAVGWPK